MALLWALPLALLSREGARADGPTTVRVAFHVPPSPEGPLVSDAWIAERLDWANTIFEPAGIRFERAPTPAFGGEPVAMHTRRDRHGLGQHVRSGVVNCFVVSALRDVDEPSRFRQGVHWRSRTVPGTHYVILSQIAAPTTLAHELGHFFGNPQHSPTPGNIMSYDRGDQTPFLDEGQKARIARALRRYLQTGELQPAERSEAPSP